MSADGCVEKCEPCRFETEEHGGVWTHGLEEGRNGCIALMDGGSKCFALRPEDFTVVREVVAT